MKCEQAPRTARPTLSALDQLQSASGVLQLQLGLLHTLLHDVAYVGWLLLRLRIPCVLALLGALSRQFIIVVFSLRKRRFVQE